MTVSAGAAIRQESGKCKQNMDHQPVVALAAFPPLLPGIAPWWLMGVSSASLGKETVEKRGCVKPRCPSARGAPGGLEVAAGTLCCSGRQ